MRVKGLHVLAEMHDCDIELLQDLHRLETLVKDAADENGFTVEDCIFHQFNQEGISGVVIAPDANFSIHTWPESRRATFDLVACREDLNLLAPCECLVSKLDASHMTAAYSKRDIEVGSAVAAM